MIDIIIKIIPGIIIAIFTSSVAAYLTAKWSLKKFYSEKWWERKENAYSDIINALYDLLQYCEIQREDWLGETGYSDENMKDFGERHSRAFWKIKKATTIGAFVVSHEAEKILIELYKRPQLDWAENPPWECYEQERIYYHEALTRIVEVANRDLKASRT